MTFANNFTEKVKACFTGIWIETSEPDEAQRQIHTIANAEGWTLHSWDVARGFDQPNMPPAAMDAMTPLKIISTNATPGTDATTILLLHNYHKFLAIPAVAQALFNLIITGKTARIFAVILSPSATIPPELEKVINIIDHELPTTNELKEIANGMGEEEKSKPDESAITAAMGLTHYEAESAFALSMARHGKIKPEEVWETKAQMVKKAGVLDMHRGKEKFADLGGLDAIKQFCTKALAPQHNHSKPKAKGILLLGVPGAGKSAFAKALGNETRRPTLILELGSMFGSLVGQTEERIRKALKIADAMSPAILFVDEIEKGLSGSASSGGHSGDSGTSQRLFATLLTWMNDHTSDVFFIGTCNDISALPPEFSRAERFDAIYFVDLPTSIQRKKIWTIYGREYKTPELDLHHLPPDDNWTGAEIKACCRLSALLEIPLSEAAANVVPIANTAGEKIAALREWANGRCLDASLGGIYHNTKTQTNSTTRRIIQRKEC